MPRTIFLEWFKVERVHSITDKDKLIIRRHGGGSALGTYTFDLPLGLADSNSRSSTGAVFAVKDNLVVVIVGYWLEVIDVSLPADPQKLGTLILPFDIDPRGTVKLVKDVAIISSRYSSTLYKVDISVPSACRIISWDGGASNFDPVSDFAVHGSNIFLSRDGRGNFVNLESHFFSATTVRLKVNKLATYQKSLLALSYAGKFAQGSFSSDSLWTVKGIQTFPDALNKVAVHGASAYLLGDSSVSLLDADAGFTPTVSQNFTSAASIAFYDDKVIVGGPSSFSVYNETTTDPWNLISDTASTGITDMLVADKTLLVARGTSKVQFYDIYANNTLSAPAEVLPFASVSQLAFNSQYYFIVNAGLGVGIYSPGTVPTFVNMLSIIDSISKIVAKHQLLFVATESKVSIYDVSNPLQITTLSQHTISKGKIADMILTDNRLILAKGIDGLEVLQAKNLGKHWVQSVKLSGERPITDKTIYNLTWTTTTADGVAANTSFQLNYQHPPTVSSSVAPQ